MTESESDRHRDPSCGAVTGRASERPGAGLLRTSRSTAAASFRAIAGPPVARRASQRPGAAAAARAHTRPGPPAAQMVTETEALTRLHFITDDAMASARLGGHRDRDPRTRAGPCRGRRARRLRSLVN